MERVSNEMISKKPSQSTELALRPTYRMVKVSSGKLQKKSTNRTEATRLTRVPRFPPCFDACPSYMCRRRFRSAESVDISGGSTFTIQNGHQQFLVVTVASTTAACWVDCWRIRSLSFWVLNHIENPCSLTVTPQSVDIDTNNFNDREASYSIISNSEAQPGAMKIVPSPYSPLGGWHKSSTVNTTGPLFLFQPAYGGASSGDWSTQIMDIEFEFVPHLVGTVGAYTTTVSTGAVGTLGGKNVLVSATGMILQDINNLT